MKNIKDLLMVDYDILITGITDDSRDVQNGFLFVATKGFRVDHYDYILDAIERGCSFLVVDREIDFDFPHIVVENILEVYQTLCVKFYDVDLSKFHFIGITGTDGKTTTATIVKEIVGACAYIGTNGLTIGETTTATNNTTPCISELYKDFREIQDASISNTVMEVSSEALLHNRVHNLSFDIVAFTNITGDHLNVHGSFENYVNCKMKLLDFVSKDGIVLVNGDDPNLQKVDCRTLYTFGFEKDNDFTIQKVRYLSKNVLITVKKEDKVYTIDSPLKGKHNVYNVVMAFLIGLFFGVEESLLLKRIRGLHPIKGRCEFLDFGQDYDIVLDYAHTIHGISTILDTFQDYSPIITVTGAAGGREKEKRPVIGKMVIEKSDIAIFTMDDPRYERVDDIIDEMVGDAHDYIRISDRKEAIFQALSMAPSGSVVLILGKGRDSYMAVEDRKIPYNDYDVIAEYFQKN